MLSMAPLPGIWGVFSKLVYRESLKSLKGPGAVPWPCLVKVRRLEKTRHCAELSEIAEACMLRLFPESYARWRATALRPILGHSWVVGNRVVAREFAGRS